MEEEEGGRGGGAHMDYQELGRRQSDVMSYGYGMMDFFDTFYGIFCLSMLGAIHHHPTCLALHAAAGASRC